MGRRSSATSRKGVDVVRYVDAWLVDIEPIFVVIRADLAGVVAGHEVSRVRPDDVPGARRADTYR
jgi:hypothetical protein